MNDLINNFKSILNNNSSTQENNSQSETAKNSNLNITPEMITNLTSMLKNSSNNEETQENSSNFSGNIDIETILKIKTIVEKLNNKDDPRAKLLYSLKPYLRDSRKQKLDQYVNLLKLTSISDFFKSGNGDE